MIKDSIIVASHHINPDWSLSEESKKRVDAGIFFLKEGVANYIIMNGGPGKYTEPVDGSIFVKRNGKVPPHSDIMKEYALKLGVPKNMILTQNYSTDTVGEAFFVKSLILEPKDFKDNILITSNYHLMRSERIYDFILGKYYSIDFRGVKIPGKDLNVKVLEEEIKGLNIFIDLMKDVKPGNNFQIQEALYKNHGIYKNIPENERLMPYKN